MQSSWFKLFGKNFKIKTAQYVNDKTRYDIDKENNVITIFTKNIAKLETNIQYVYQDLFFKVLVPVIKEIIKEVVVKSGLNTIDFKFNQKAPLVIKYYDKQKTISNVQTHEVCDKCGANMILRVAKQTGNKFLGCSRFPKCTNTLSPDVKSTEKSKNGWYLYGNAFLMTMPKEVIKSKIIYCLIQTYIKYDTYDFYVELAKLCPNYFVLNGMAADGKLKAIITHILKEKNEEVALQVIPMLFPDNVKEFEDA